MDALIGSVALLRQFPVKSTAGESLERADVDDRGLVDDRRWAAYLPDGGIASGKTTRRFRRVDGLLLWRSAMRDGRPELHSPTGATYPVADPAASAALSGALGRSLTLRQETAIRHHDESHVHVVTTSALRAVEALVAGAIDPRRARANIVVAADGVGFVEDEWIDASLLIGPDVVLRIGPGMPRCVMLDQPQADVPVGPPILRALGRAHRAELGATATVLRTGTISVGDQVRLSRTPLS